MSARSGRHASTGEAELERIIDQDVPLPVEGHMPSLEGASGWLNSAPLTPAGLKGRVVAVDFCTYTCINWLRSLPYVRAWAERYTDQGLVTIGVHTPEFSFERNVENVRRALADMRVEYPVALDNDYEVWDAFANRYWPALYLVDAKGRIRHHRFGEGDYERSERVIQQLLAEAGAGDVDRNVLSVNGVGPEAAADWDDLESAETYVGYEQEQGFASPGGTVPEHARVYAVPERLGPNEWALSGAWTMNAENIVSNEPNARVALRFHARDVHLVMGRVRDRDILPFRVFLDGEPPGDAAGSDVDAAGRGSLDEPRMYQLVRQRGSIGSRVFEIAFEERGAQAFAFTFG
jgi:Thioredoxin like C-terminal domain/AhpC/TSA family